jgi:hypothetical protein
MQIQRKIDVTNLVRELAENKVSALELVREALSNAKDHLARRVWVRTTRSPRGSVSVLLMDDGEGMTDERLEAFWGVGASAKSAASIGYKGHGTKLYFDCQRLTVATRATGDAGFRLLSLESPAKKDDLHVPVRPLSPEDALFADLQQAGLLEGTGTAILIEHLSAEDADALLSRSRVESYCDWFTVIGDVRSGLFDSRLAFHQALQKGGDAIEALRPNEVSLQPLTVRLKVNGEKDYFPLGQGPTARDKEFLAKWHEDLAAFAAQPGLLAFGHRFADQHFSAAGAKRVRDDMTAICLTAPSNWVNEDGLAIVARVEGHRRQRETYLEASWQNHNGLYSFDGRFGLWLCRDFVPMTQRNDLLRRALEQASKGRLRFDFNSTRNWQIFINYQRFLPTANRNGISNQEPLEARIVEALVAVLSQALKQESFLEWVSRLRQAKLDAEREVELKHMDDRRDGVVTWINSKAKKDVIDPMAVTGLPELERESSLQMQAPRSEQELFYLYGLLSARFEMPIQVLEYDASQGVDAIGLVRNPKLVQPPATHGRIEFKFEVSANNPIDHFFDAIDVIVCWKVDRIGDIYEKSSSGQPGKLRKRKQSLLNPALDTHEIAYEAKNGERVIPVLQLSTLFTKK